MSKLKILDTIEKKEVQRPADDLYARPGDILKSSGRTDQIFNSFADDENGLDIPDTKISNIVIREISLDLITVRNVNNFIKNKVSEVQESIEANGQFEPIIIQVNPDKNSPYKYVIVAGHQRYKAMCNIRDKYAEDKSDTRYIKYSYIQARILSKEEELKEEIIYKETNTIRREAITPFEMLLDFNVRKINMDDPETRQLYIETCYGKEALNDYNDGRRTFKFNVSAKTEYLQKLIQNKFKKEIGSKAVSTYALMIEKAISDLIKEILEGNIPLREGVEIARYDITDQYELITSYGTDEYKKLMEELKKENSVKGKITPTTSDAYSEILKIEKALATKSNEFKAIVKTIDKKKMNGNQKEFIKEFSKVINKIDNLLEMDKK